MLKTDGNFNNDIGVPLTIFRIEKEHTAAVIEMGMNHFGEISKLTRIANPDIA
ncbi:MAG: UDP-N-acetylmuramoyl-tripeptide--D-alanyl-D-alanine ligase, partial [Firmicutes bacterium]|nr:UDP-N-acetylmuramoyl-tripeptide--D-alanyl-D-alanine ligase [Bacillota bacterium]